MSSRYKFIKKILFLFVFMFLLIDTIYLYNLNEKTKLTSKIERMSVELILLNKDLDIVFEHKLDTHSVQEWVGYPDKIKQILEQIRQDSGLEKFFQVQANMEIFENVDEKMRQKLKILEDFKRYSLELKYPQKRALNASKQLFEQESSKDTKHVGFISNKLLFSSFENSKNIQNLKLLNDKFLSEASSKKAYDFFSEVKRILDKFGEMHSSKLKKDRLNMDEHLMKFRESLNAYNEDVVSKLYVNMSFYFIIIVVFIVAVLWLLDSVQYRTKTMMQFQQAVQNSDNAVIITDTDHRILYINNAFEKITGYSEEEVLGKTPAILQSGLHDKSFFEEMNEKIRSGESWIGEFSNRRKDGQIIYEKTSIYPMLDESGKIEGYLGIKLNVTDEKKYLNEIENKSLEVLFKYQIDDATGLWSRNVLNDELARNTIGYLIYIKVKNFKDLRFFYGTKTANKIIKNMADRLKRFIYVYKVSGQPFVIGEDDFCIWYKQKKPPTDLLEAIDSYFASPVDIEGTLQPIDILMGVSTDRNLPQGDRLWQAMIAFYKAEQNNVPYVYYDIENELEKDYRQNLITARRIKNALNKELVSVECQPIFDTYTKQLYSYEVLMRTRDENGKIMYPNEFLDIAKQSLLYSPLMHNVIYLTFELVKSYPDSRFSINMSSIDMLDEDTSRIFLNLLESSDNPQNVIIEVLESEGISSYSCIKPFLQKAKSLGCLLSIDDFGSGYSNYYRIMELDIDTIKIDGEIIKKLPYNEDSQVVVETIVGFAKKKGYKVVAEYVSDDEIYKKVKEYGIDYTQGFYLGKPMALPIVKHSS